MPYKNKADQKKCAAKHYENNKDIVKSRAVTFKKMSRKRNRKFVDDFLSENPCIDCGESDIVVLEFDHIGTDKAMDVSMMVSNGTGIERLKKEIAKCQVRCANCHRRITRKRRLETEK